MTTEVGQAPASDEARSLRGRVIAPGVAFGYVYIDQAVPVEVDDISVPAAAVSAEVSRLRTAVSRVKQHLADHVRDFHAPTDEDMPQVVAAHQLILEDARFLRQLEERIERDAVRAEYAVEQTFCDVADRLAASNDAYLSGRAEDLRDVCQTIRVALARGEEGLRPSTDTGDRGPVVFVAPHLHVSAVLRAQRAGAVAFVTRSDAHLSHGAILLRASGIPSVGGVRITESLSQGTPVLVDGDRGTVVVRPSAEQRLPALPSARAPESARGEALRPLEAVTADGASVRLWANIDNAGQVRHCLDERLHGIGLFRTEFLMLGRGRAPTEAEQLDVYSKVVEELAGRAVVLRTFDIGGDKVVAGLQEDMGANPALGVRGLRRHLLRRPGELRTQLRAILRATVGADAVVLLPMVTHAADIRAARSHLDSVKRELAAAGIPHNDRIRLGAMIEVPAAVLRIDKILREVDMASIGTNDLTQYLCAADRNNASVGRYLDPERCGLFELLEHMMKRVRAAGRERDVLVCGELSSDPRYSPRFVQLGFRGLVIRPQAAARVRKALAETHAEQAES